jgi:hypothetical protein
MKTFLISITAGSFLLALLLYSCQPNENTVLTDQDQALIQGMKESFENARIFNDSLEALDKNSFPFEYASCDSAFHYYSGRFDSLHHYYPHVNGHDNHYHNGTGMHMMNSMMQNHHNWTDGHHREEHDLMEGLNTDHYNRFH